MQVSQDATVDDAVGEVARRIEPDLEGLTRELADHFLAVIVEFRHDDALRELMMASTAANLAAIVDMLTHGIATENVAVPTAAAEYARRFARRDLSLEALLRAYRLGEHRFGQRALRAVGELDLPTGTALEVAALVAQRTNRYIDRVIEALIDIYSDEHRQWNARSDAARVAGIRAVLATPSLDVGAAEATLGASLRNWHVAAVLWDADGGSARLRALEAGLTPVTGRPPLCVLAEADRLWVWWSATTCPRPDPARLAALCSGSSGGPGVRIALGAPGAGLDGFRASHREALLALSMLELGDSGEPVLDYADVAPVALLAQSSDDLRTWVIRTLGDLARDDETMARLRATVRAYLQAGGSSTDAAAALHLHKNTVHYRLRRAEEALGHPVGSAEGDRLAVEVALLACHHLGTRVLS